MDPGLTQNDLDRLTVSTGIATVIGHEIPQEYLDRPGVGTAGTSTCKWQLH